MRPSSRSGFILLSLLACVAVARAQGPAPGRETSPWPWKRFTQSSQVGSARPWEWVIALPHGATRAEVVIPTVSGSTLRALLPPTPFVTVPEALASARPDDASLHAAVTRAMAGPTLTAQLFPQPQGAVRLAAANVAAMDYRIVAVEGRSVPDYNHLHAAVSRAVNAGKAAAVAIVPCDGGREDRLSLAPVQLASLGQIVAPQERLLRVVEGGNPWVVFRQNGVRCKLLVRVERAHGIAQVAIAPRVCGPRQAVLPQEVRASCDGVPLQCLTVAETLEALYGGSKPKDRLPPPETCSFARVSERDDYRLPTNYRRLQEAADKAAGASPTVPALASLPGLAYPGSPILGDARALSAFLQQRQLYRPGEPDQVGWIIFAGEKVRHAQLLCLDIDLGAGPSRLTFALPTP